MAAEFGHLLIEAVVDFRIQQDADADEHQEENQELAHDAQDEGGGLLLRGLDDLFLFLIFIWTQ